MRICKMKEINLQFPNHICTITTFHRKYNASRAVTALRQDNHVNTIVADDLANHVIDFMEL